MPYIIRPKLMPRSVAVAGAVLLGSAVPAQAGGSPASGTAASPPVETVPCEVQPFTQPFLNLNDKSNYVLVPGESPNDFEGVGWNLSGGARIVQSALADGSTGRVLELPSGGEAVSPTFCVTTEYPTARTLISDVVGSEGVSFNVSYEGTASWNTPKNTGQVHGSGSQWTASAKVNMQPEGIAGWQRVKLTLIGKGKSSVFRVYNLYIDPYRR